MSDSLQFQVKFEDVKPINENFSRCKIYTLATNENRNGSFISKETVEKSLPSIYNIPIVGEYLENEDNFGGHGGKIEITDKEIKFVSTTRPYGVVPESANIYWENVTEEDGSIAEYLVVEDAILWTGRYEEIQQLLDNPFGESMEIDINAGEYKEINGKKLYCIDDFTFSALCILGIDKDGNKDYANGHVEPCFPSSSIVAYSFNKDSFKEEFKKMMVELKFALNHAENKDLEHEGGQKMEELQKLLDKYSLTLEDLSSKDIKHEDYSLEELESKIQEVFRKQEFTLTAEQLEDELKRELAEIETIQDEYWEDYSYPRYSFVDYMPDQMVVVAYDCKNCVLIGFNYSLINENVEVDAESGVRYKVQYLPMDLAGDPDSDDMFTKHFTSHSQLERQLKMKENELNKQFQAEKESAQETLDKAYADFAKLQEEFSKLEANAKELEEFKLKHLQKEREVAENELFERFLGFGLTEDDLATIKENKSNFTIEELEEKLFALAGRKKLSFSKVQENKSIRYNLPIDNKPSSDKEWADLIEQYKNK